MIDDKSEDGAWKRELERLCPERQYELGYTPEGCKFRRYRYVWGDVVIEGVTLESTKGGPGEGVSDKAAGDMQRERGDGGSGAFQASWYFGYWT